MDTGQIIIILVSILMGAWYVGGSLVNRRRGVATYQWLRAGLETYGKISVAKWIGTAASGARMVLEQPRAPFRQLEAVFLLDSREILPLWLFNLLRRKSDEMVLKANLRKTPAFQLEAARPGRLNLDKIKEQSGSDARLGAGAGLQQQEIAGFEIAAWGKEASKAELNAANFLTRYGAEILSLSLRRSSPHLIVKVKLPNIMPAPAEAFLEALEAWLKGLQPAPGQSPGAASEG